MSKTYPDAMIMLSFSNFLNSFTSLLLVAPDTSGKLHDVLLIAWLAFICSIDLLLLLNLLYTYAHRKKKKKVSYSNRYILMHSMWLCYALLHTLISSYNEKLFQKTR